MSIIRLSKRLWVTGRIAAWLTHTSTDLANYCTSQPNIFCAHVDIYSQQPLPVADIHNCLLTYFIDCFLLRLQCLPDCWLPLAGKGTAELAAEVHSTEYTFVVNIMLLFTVVLQVGLFSLENVVGQALMVHGPILPMCSVHRECLSIFTESQHWNLSGMCPKRALLLPEWEAWEPH